MLLLVSPGPDCLPVTQPFRTTCQENLKHKCKVATTCLLPSIDPSAKGKAVTDKNHHLSFKSFSRSNPVSHAYCKGHRVLCNCRKSGLHYRRCFSSSSSSPHCLLSDVSPIQDFPPPLGGGLLHSRLLVFFPWTHGPQEDQQFHCPSTPPTR